MRAPIIFLAALFAGTPLGAQGFREKDTAYVLIPISLLTPKGGGLSSPRWEGLIDSAGRVNGMASWREQGFPRWIGWYIDQIKIDRKKRTAEINLYNASASRSVRLKFEGWDESAFGKVLVAPSGLAAAKDEIYALFRAKYFTDKLAQLADATKNTLISFVAEVGNGSAISNEVFKDRTYLVVNLPDLGVVYNDARLSTAQRTATVLNETVLGVLKKFAKQVEGAPEVEGVKLNVTIAHRNFVTVGASSDFDKLELYAPADLIRKFAAQDATGQELLDGSFVVLNGNRIKVDLTQS